MLRLNQIESRPVSRHRVVLPALCWSDGRSDFYAVTHDISIDGICFRSSVVPEREERLICSIRHVGQINGVVTFAGAETFVIKIHARTPSIGSIAKDLVALARQQVLPDTQSRVHRRIVPLRTQVAVHLPCGRTIPGKLLNVSASGAALHVGEPIELGIQFRIGETWARVVRQFESGVGAAFLEPLDPQEVSEHIQL